MLWRLWRIDWVFWFDNGSGGVGMSDPNVLFSTAMQASATVVAILGGFIVSRILSLSSERNGIVSQLEDIRDTREIKKKHLERLQIDATIESVGEIILRDLRDLLA